MQYGGCVYILSNELHTVLYIGVTSNFYARISEHKEKIHTDSFTAKYNCDRLVYYESYSRIEEAIAREKILKKWNREWKENLIIKINPDWKDLFQTI
jgi:putative endonuclease